MVLTGSAAHNPGGRSMPKGVVKEGKGTLIGNAGEFFVAGELLRRGYVAALAPRNAPSFDILASARDRFIRVRVKAKSHPSKVWQWMAKSDGSLFREVKGKDDFCILVDLKSLGEPPCYYVIPTADVNRFMSEKRQVWISTPGRGGRPHDPTSRHHALDVTKHNDFLKEYLEKWDLIEP